MGKKKKREEPSGPKGAPEWVVTFTDMISLLVTFFVLLMTFSSMETYDAEMIDSFLQGTRGVHEASGYTMVEPGKADSLSASSLERGARRPHTRPAEKLPESLEEMGQEKTEKHQELDLTDVTDGLIIEFDEEASFDPGSTRVNAELTKSLGEIGRVLENYPHLVVVEGFTDAAFQPSLKHKTEAALSVGRARAAAETLLRLSKMNPDLVQVAGLGSTTPRADNESASGRRLNRRVRLRVLSLSKARANHLQAQEDAER